MVYTFDGDSAGQKAALKAFDSDQRFAANTYVAVAPAGMDPCELRQAKGDEAVRALVENRSPLFAFAITTTLEQYNLDTAEGRVAATNAAIPLVAGIKEQTLRDEYVRRLAGLAGFRARRPSAAGARVRRGSGAGGEAGGRRAAGPTGPARTAAGRCTAGRPARPDRRFSPIGGQDACRQRRPAGSRPAAGAAGRRGRADRTTWAAGRAGRPRSSFTARTRPTGHCWSNGRPAIGAAAPRSRRRRLPACAGRGLHNPTYAARPRGDRGRRWTARRRVEGGLGRRGRRTAARPGRCGRW